MKAYEFPLKVTPDGSLEVPDALRNKLLDEQVGQVIVLVKEPSDVDDQADWSRLSGERFLAGYSEADAIYDKIR
jgi:hypothetical protein